MELSITGGATERHVVCDVMQSPAGVNVVKMQQDTNKGEKDDGCSLENRS